MNADQFDIGMIIDGIKNVGVPGPDNSKNVLHAFFGKEGGDELADFYFHFET